MDGSKIPANCYPGNGSLKRGRCEENRMQAHRAAATLTHATKNHVCLNELSKKVEQHEITPSSYKNKCNITEPSALDTPVTAGDHLGCTLIWQSESIKNNKPKAVQKTR